MLIGKNLTTRILTNKTFLNSLEKVANHSASFSAGTSLIMSLTVRPATIALTPEVEKENKQYAIANSISSGIIKFAIAEAIILPIENAVKNLEKFPEKFLNKDTINNLANSTTNLKHSRPYNLLTQFIKLGAGFLTAIPKSTLTVALIPIIMDNIFKINNKNKKIKNINQKPASKSELTFSGSNSILERGISKIIDNKYLQSFAIKYQKQDEDIAKNMSIANDILLTTTSVIRTSKSHEIKEDRKKALIYNNLISTAITVLGGNAIDKFVKNKTAYFLEKFKQLNANDVKLNKYIEGLNIIRPAIIFAGIYYGILPMFSTFFAQKIDDIILKTKDK